MTQRGVTDTPLSLASQLLHIKHGEIGMVFSSNVFLFLFLPIFLGLYYLSGQRYRNLLLLIASYVFYAWWRVDFLALFAGVTLWNYWIGLKVGAAGVRTKPAQRWLLLGVAVDLCILGYFKYANF